MVPSPTKKDISTSSHVEEEHIEGMGEIKVPESDLKLDSNGLPLEPQPSDHKDDPLVRGSLKKWQTKELLALIHGIAELAKLVQILRPALTLHSCIYRTV